MRRRWACAGKAAPGGRAGSRGPNGGAAAHHPQRGSDVIDWGSVLPLPRRFVRHPARRNQGTVLGCMAGEIAELARYVKWAERMRGGRERCGTHPFRDLLHRAGRPQDRGPGMTEDRWRRLLGEAPPGMDLAGPKKGGEGSGCRC